jgi:protein-L-isoaspartate(D-aspartate) O-methyltransferase
MAAAATHVPEALLEQLAPGGRLVMPLGGRDQLLTLIAREADGFSRRTLEPVRFVPLVPGASV